MNAVGGLARELGQIVGDDHVLTDAGAQAGYVRDWTGRWVGECALVVRPGTPEQAAAVLRAVAAYGAHVVLQGGNTGLVGGAVPAAGDVLLSTTRLTAVGALDTAAGLVTVEAGVTLGGLQTALRPSGFELALDLAARDSATVGGLAATNAGGTRALRDGTMAMQVVAADALDVAGRQLASLRPLHKDNTGYRLASLLVGSEGTLGLITRLVLRVVPVASHRAAALLGLPDVASAQRTLAALRARLPQLRAAELMDGATLQLVRAQAGLPPPFGGEHPAYLLLEVAGPQPVTPQLRDALAEVVAAGQDAAHIAVADDGAGVRALWDYRERATESISATGVPHKVDVTLPRQTLDAFLQDLSRLVAGTPGVSSYVFGHLGDGNLHVNLLGLGADDASLDVAVLRLAASHGGTISGEHGIGRLKAPWLSLRRTPDELTAMAAVKAALDPQGRLGRALLGAPKAG